LFDFSSFRARSSSVSKRRSAISRFIC
jgi:hypothetical protein